MATRRQLHAFFLTVILSLAIFTNSGVLGIRYTGNESTEFIRKSCRVTLYPALCFNSLSTHARDIQTSCKKLATTALSVTLSTTRNTSSFMRKLSRSPEIVAREVGPLRDCLELLGDTVEKLEDSIAEMGRIKKGKNFNFLISNIQTWVSAALTNEGTCSDGLSGTSIDKKVKIVVSEKMESIAHLTSNALALINSYASHHHV